MKAIYKLINAAIYEVGYIEKKSNKYLYEKTANIGAGNYTKYAYEIDKNFSGFYNGKKNGHAWCDVFFDWLFITTFGVGMAKRMLCQPDNSLGAGCKYSMNYYKKNDRFYKTAELGDQIFFYNNDKTNIAHTGLVVNVDENYVYTIEGNARIDGDMTGGRVANKTYAKNNPLIAGYGRPHYDLVVYKPTVLEWQKSAVADGFTFKKYGTDGKWGSECRSVAKKAVIKKHLIGYKYPELTKIVQYVLGVTVDGKCGKQTKQAIKQYQREHGLTADGCVGVNTWECMLGV